MAGEGTVKSFSLTRKDKPKSRPSIVQEDGEEGEAPQRELIKSISASGEIKSVNERPKVGPLVIPLASQRTFLKHKHNNDNNNSKADGGKAENKGENEGDDNGESDLDTAARNAVLAEALGKANNNQDAPLAAIPLLQQNTVPGIADIADEKERFQHDLSLRPDEATLEAYEATPVDKFGEAALRGMGWAPGKPVGLNAKEAVQPIEFVRRHHRAGMGAEVMDEMPKKRKYIKPGESREAKTLQRLPTGPNGQVRHVRRVDEQMIDAAPTVVREGVLVSIESGRHQGLEGRVLSLAIADEVCTLRLTASEETVTVGLRDVEIVDEAQRKYEQRKYGLLKGDAVKGIGQEMARLNSKSSHRDRDRERDRDDSGRKRSRDGDKEREGDRHRHRHKHAGQDREERHSKKRRRDADGGDHNNRGHEGDEDRAGGKSWVRSNIRVRVLSKKIDGGGLYMKKGVVVDVLRPGVALVQMDNGKLSEVKEKALETALPKVGGEVLVLRGADQGKRATLKERDSASNRGVVQLVQELTPLVCALDDIAEFVGDSHLE